MQARTFRAPTIAEAYQEVRDELGPDALILSTRSGAGSGPLGLRNRAYVEVVAGIPDEDGIGVPSPRAVDDQIAVHDFARTAAEETARRPAPRPSESPLILAGGRSPSRAAGAHARSAYASAGADRVTGSRASASDSAVASAAAFLEQAAHTGSVDTAEESSDLAPPFVNPLAGSERPSLLAARGPAFDETAGESAVRPAAPVEMPGRSGGISGTLLQDLVAEVAALRTAVDRMAARDADRRVEAGPGALRDVRAQLERNDLGGPLLVTLLDRLSASLAEDASAPAVWRAAERRLTALLPRPVTLDTTRQSSVIALVGPSGAGKTTAAVRLALELAQRGLAVVVAGTDVDRAGAPQQLEAYAAVTGLPVRLCYTPAELQDLIEGEPFDVVVVDTPGHDGTRPDQVAELQAFLQVVDAATVLLTLPATLRAGQLDLLAERYRVAEPSGLVVTRCDESTAFGGIATVASRAGLGIAYTTHGARTSEALRPGDNHMLATAVLRGGWPSTSTAAAAERVRARGGAS